MKALDLETTHAILDLIRDFMDKHIDETADTELLRIYFRCILTAMYENRKDGIDIKVFSAQLRDRVATIVERSKIRDEHLN